MSQYGEDYQPRRPRGRDDEFPPPPPYPAQGGMPAGPPDHLPPPPMGDNRRPSAMKREGSRSRVPQHTRPDFPDEASYLGSQAPDLERKNRRRDKEFRDKRDGYESEEGEMLRQKKPRSNRDEEPDSRHRRNRDDRDADYNGGSSRRPKDRYDDRPPRGEPPPSSGYDDRDRDPPRRRRERQDDDYDDDPPPRRRGGAPPVEYGSEPISAIRRRNTDLGRSRDDKPRRRRDDPDDYSDDDEPPRRHRSAEGRDRDRRRRDKYDDEDRHNDPDSRDQRRRRQEMYDRDRDSRRNDPPRRRRYSDDEDEDDYDRRDSRRDRDRDRRKPPREMKVGGYDIGPLIDTGKKHYGTVAPIVAPLLMNAARKYLTNQNKILEASRAFPQASTPKLVMASYTYELIELGDDAHGLGCKCCRFSKGLDLPSPRKDLSTTEARKLALGFATSVLRDWTALNAILKRFEGKSNRSCA
ncbi:hypothetical protein LTR03_007375 [Friedmanniomyces endolithicus]|nr:hypothetical protein LTR03_007375 [Friedmanniomyces endolithicus]